MKTDTLIIIGLAAVVGYFVLLAPKRLPPTSPVTGAAVPATGSTNPWNDLARSVGTLLGSYSAASTPSEPQQLGY